ncbi:hypothetical protein CY34DRAFT_812164 [Suillus luteus UH-Slu-Lm8-n1]|uniref:Uncharacterized protein n=1 Tax=Suillus luteus UH-Slu-Lm8-n1 TaxID=930992 RepID=A0A0C9ZD71_9AGAM|nr:hypothetical protein CY34DRAFT_812164 [Suillus luteus UH-Slu-Lm8-n1]
MLERVESRSVKRVADDAQGDGRFYERRRWNDKNECRAKTHQNISRYMALQIGNEELLDLSVREIKGQKVLNLTIIASRLTLLWFFDLHSWRGHRTAINERR